MKIRGVTLVPLLLTAAAAETAPRLVRKIDFGDYGSRQARFGDLDGDGAPEILLVQHDVPAAFITCLTAVTLEGKVLWQTGKPRRENSYYRGDNVQIYDLDRDGNNEVIYNSDNKRAVTILEGRSGRVKRKIPLSQPYDTILFADFGGRGYPQEVFMMSEKGFTIFNSDFKPLWSKRTEGHPGHYPINYDVDGDGRDELIVGYAMYDHAGNELWNHREFPEHNDATYIDDMDGDGSVEIAMATSRDAVLMDKSGRILFRKAMQHCQHALIGKFRPDLPGKQVVFLSREEKKGTAEYGYARIAMFTKAGEELWSREDKDSLWVSAIQRIDNWDGGPGNLIALYGRWFAQPVLLDGRGRQVAGFDFPPAILERGDGRFVPEDRSTAPGGGKIYGEHHVDHLSCWGDEREEILVYNQNGLYIYTNPALLEKPRLYNHNYFPGRR